MVRILESGVKDPAASLAISTAEVTQLVEYWPSKPDVAGSLPVFRSRSMKMKKVECAYKECGLRRRHWCDPDTPRGTRLVEVPDDFDDSKSAFCSLTCAISAGHYSLKTGWKKNVVD